MSDASSRELLERLIGFATVSRDSNLELIRFIEAYLAEHGVQSELFFNEEGTKANLFATIGPLVSGGWCSPVTPMWCRLTGRRGRSIRSG